MFIRKPRNIVSKVIDLTTKTSTTDASHTWMAEDPKRRATFGSTSRETFEQRRQIDRERKTVARYGDSRIAHSATQARGDLTRAAKRDRELVKSRFDKTKDKDPTVANPVPPQVADFSSPKDSSFYPEFRPKL
jgi:hypothetical protein